MGAMIALFLINICETRAQSIQDCASQENCFIMLNSSGVLVTREGVEKGLITELGAGAGYATVDRGYILVTRSTYYAYLYNIETGVSCSIDLEDECKPGIITEYSPGEFYAVFVCPQTDYTKFVSMGCEAYTNVSISEPGATHIVRGDELNYVSLNSTGNIVEMLGVLASYFYTGMDWNKELVYRNGFLYINGYNGTYGIFSKKVDPMETGAATPFIALPEEGSNFSGTSDYGAVTGSNSGYILDFNNPANIVTVPIPSAQESAVSPATAGEPVRVYFSESGTIIRIFDETGTELGFSPLNESVWDLAYAAPTLPPACGNSLVEPGETCDGTDFDGDDCQNYGFDGGTLSCSAACDQIFTSGCWSCGDGVLNPGESCDGTDMGTGTCQDEGYEAGEIGCNSDCTYNYDMCYTCGNGLLEAIEECEGADLNGADCTTEGFVSGNLKCGTDCMYDVSECSACGDGITNYEETCDATDTPGMICQTMGLGYTGGDLVCNTTCDGYDDSGCYTCGDGNVDANEECDGANLDGQDCGTLGLGSGTLSCFGNCTFNLNDCSDAPAEYCGNGVLDPGEECDDGNRSNSDDCSEFCKIIPPTCGLGGIDPGETCDGTDLGGETCQSQGYQDGVLYCGDDCQLRTDGCSFTSTPETISLELDAEPESGELDESLQDQYENLQQTLTPNCVSQDVNGDLVITTTQGSYCAVRATVLNKSVEEKMFSFIYKPENSLEDEPPVLRFYQNGGIAQNLGGHITAYQGLQVKTVLVQDRLYHVTQERIASMGMKFLSAHPETNISGRWLAVNIGTGSTSMCADEQAETCARLVPDQGQVVINLDALEDLSEIDWEPPKDGGGCSCNNAHGPAPSTSLPLMFLLIATLLFWKRCGRLK